MARPDRRRQRPDEPQAAGDRSARCSPSARWRSCRCCSPACRCCFFDRLADSAWGKGMVAVRDAEIAARSIGLNPVIIKTAAFALSAVFTGLAGAIFAPLFMFVAPDSFPFSQSILFLLAVIVGGAGWVFGPGGRRGHQRGRSRNCCRRSPSIACCSSAGCCWSCCGSRRRACSARWRALPTRRRSARRPTAQDFDVAGVHAAGPATRSRSTLSGIGIAFGGIKAATDVSFVGRARPDHQRDRAERRRQDHRAQHDRRVLPAGQRQHPARRPGTGRRAGLEDRARRHRAHLSDHQAVRQHERARQRADRAAPRPARRHAGRRRLAPRTAAPPKRCSPSSAITARSRRRPATCRMSTAVWSRSRARWRCGRACCCSTSPPPG